VSNVMRVNRFDEQSLACLYDNSYRFSSVIEVRAIMPRGYALGERFERFIEEKVKSGRFGNASEVVRTGLGLLEDQERRRELELEKLRQSIDEGRRGGTPKPADEVFARLEAKYGKMHQNDG
jgi:antitoxin ParD1/3/4